MTITIDSVLKRATISNTTEQSPQTIESVIDAIYSVDPINSFRLGNIGWIGSSWHISFLTPTDFLHITPYFNLEFRDLAAIRFTGSLILDLCSNVVYSRSTGLGSGNFATFQNSACKLVTKRYLNEINPKVTINCGNSRSDIFGSQGMNVYPIHNIEGIDLIYQGQSFGNQKLFFNALSSVNNIFSAGSSRAIQQYSSRVFEESGCPSFNNIFFELNNISGEIAANEAYIRLINCTFAGNENLLENYRSTAFIIVDPVFTKGIPLNIGATDNAGNINARQEIRYTYGINFVDTLGNNIVGSKVRFTRDNDFTIDIISNSLGLIETQELRSRSKPVDLTLSARSVTPLTIHRWTVTQRHYNYLSSRDTITDNEVLNSSTSKLVTMFPDQHIDLSESASSVLQGITIDKLNKVITVNGCSVSDLYHYYRYWITQFENFDTEVFIKISLDTIEVFNGWTLKLTLPPTPSEIIKKIKVTAGKLTIDEGDYQQTPITLSNSSLEVGSGEIDLTGSTFSPNTTVNLVGNGNSVVTVDSRQLGNLQAGTNVLVQSPSVEFIGFPVLPNINGALPKSTLGIKDLVTDTWRTYDVINGSIKVNLPSWTTGDQLLIRGDAVGYYRTVDVLINIDRLESFDFEPLFYEIVDDQGVAIIGRGIQSEKDKVTFNQNPPRFELGSGAISFDSFIDKLDELTSGDIGLSLFDDNIRDLKYQKNSYARVVQLPEPFTLSASDTAISSPILTDFICVRLGDNVEDVYEHGLYSGVPGLTDRPEVRENTFRTSGTSNNSITNITNSIRNPTVYRL